MLYKGREGGKGNTVEKEEVKVAAWKDTGREAILMGK